MSRHIPVALPLLPRAEDILPYLKMVDDARIYSNFGPLAQELSKRLAEALALNSGDVVMTSSGTSALMATILALTGGGQVGGKGRYVALPSFTFAASALAVELCGFTPYFVDVSEDTWCLTPEAVLALPLQDEIALVMPVAPFGRAVPQAAWKAYRNLTGIPVVIDAAASFSCIETDPSAYLGDIPTVFSLHATKGFGIGEGGAVACSDADLIERIGWTLNFGFAGSRESAMASFNGKLSEHQAAVGHAALDQWPAKREMLETVAALYREAFRLTGQANRLITYPEVDGGYCLYLCVDSAESVAVMQSLGADDIGHRFWYGGGVNSHLHFATAPHTDMSVSEDLARRLIGLPMFPDLSAASVARVARAVASAGAYIMQDKADK
ncbi:DegT/DnrJ/EryC1/StrS family aminotransferase [Phenylobacterium immobile]|uniref:DegT/DnrJ/EryC1/StrS family aminotransferase n=1 Tax=Phenylobacterium immobile TaxID=21 RepID=UPI00159ECE41|nr:aminotransferase class I/II-fold pyridoxal phosphate-dependent enzyme [Phenylobacterium immobile]